MTYYTLGKINALQKGPTIRKTKNLKNGSYGKKAPTANKYGIQ
jgi:hypothetical protein